MSRVVIIEGGVVTNAIVADLAWAQERYPHADVREHAQAAPGWLLEGDELAPPAPVDVHDEPDIEAIRLAVGAWLDEVTQAKGYDNIVSCVSYVGSGVAEFDGDARAAAAWRDAVWAACFAMLADPPDGVTTAEQVIWLLPQPGEFGWVQRDPIPLE